MNVTEQGILRNLEVARDHIAKFGWVRGDLGGASSPTCVDGAFRVALGDRLLDRSYIEELKVTRTYFLMYGLGKAPEEIDEWDLYSMVYRWNDTQQSKRVVLKALDRAIREVSRSISSRAKAERPAKRHWWSRKPVADPHEYRLLA